MSRPVTISDEVILKAAREVFLLHGFKARSSLIAETAGVSEGTVFKRFQTKARLFVEAMTDIRGEQKWMEQLASQPGTGTVRENVAAAARHIMEHMEVTIPRLISLRASGVPLDDPHDFLHRPPHLIQAEAMGSYFSEEIALGRLSMRQPHIQAQMFVGAMCHYVMIRQMSPQALCHRGEYIELLLDLHLGPVLPPQRSASGEKNGSHPAGAMMQ